MNILEAIVEQKRVEILTRKQKRPLSSLKTFPYYRRPCNRISLPDLEKKPGIIAEFKRKSPSRGAINMEADPVKVAGAYEAAGVAAMSILTDRSFFGGSFRDLRKVRESNPQLVLLRKDFIIDPYQLHEASAYGADIVLLIASVLDQREVEDLTLEAASLGLDLLFEVHHSKELEKFHPGIRFVGVNNRDLKRFTVDTGRSLELIGEMPPGVVPVSESGLTGPEEIRKLWLAGYKLFLMGETFMKESDPGSACRRLIDSLQA
ncbi:MAG: indole-3-glycerol phosphate synthase TrpC [Bacteroidales bacterium]|nr:indole-3-glycerol phosphate synthase TrpC [Bacteroidales bacterium]